MGHIQEKILRSSTHLYVTFGYERVNLKLIAQASGITLSNITALFYSKEEILRFSFLDAIGRMATKLVQAGSVEYKSLRAGTLQLWTHLLEYEAVHKEEYIFVQKSLKTLPYYRHDNFRNDLFKEMAPLSSFFEKMERGITAFKTLYILSSLLDVLAKKRPLNSHNSLEENPYSYFNDYVWPDIDKAVRLPFQ